MSTLSLFIIGFCLFGGMIACVLYLKNVRPVLVCLRDRHPGLWDSLGMPEIEPGAEKRQIDKMLASAFSKPLAFFLLLRKYETAGDAGLAALCAKARKPLLFAVSCGAVFLVLAVPQLAVWLFKNPFTVF
ncbi:MAG: hypothetical protein EPN97_17700 [Alphaproteobacteria bacterium]|nr:MAG: hypothetical protein EPN97_17700 [Alphaproteobacteria bacterium]